MFVVFTHTVLHIENINWLFSHAWWMATDKMVEQKIVWHVIDSTSRPLKSDTQWEKLPRPRTDGFQLFFKCKNTGDVTQTVTTG